MKASDNIKNELLNIKLSDKGTIKSTELVEIINSFRELEGKSELQHYDFMKKIRTTEIGQRFIMLQKKLRKK